MDESRAGLVLQPARIRLEEGASIHAAVDGVDDSHHPALRHGRHDGRGHPLLQHGPLLDHQLHHGTIEHHGDLLGRDGAVAMEIPT